MYTYEKVKVLVAQLCLTFCDSVDCSLPGSFVHVILQARILEWVACPSPGDLPNPGIEPESTTLQADSLRSGPLGKPLRSCIPWCNAGRGASWASFSSPLPP